MSSALPTPFMDQGDEHLFDQGFGGSSLFGGRDGTPLPEPSPPNSPERMLKQAIDTFTTLGTPDPPGWQGLQSPTQPQLRSFHTPVPGENSDNSEVGPDSPAESLFESASGDHVREHELDGHEPKYNLRESARQACAPTAWIDRDESGNYDPSAERRAPQARRGAADGSATRQHGTRVPGGNRDGRHQVYKSLESGRLNGAQLLFTIALPARFTGENLDKATSLVASIPDHWPEGSYNNLLEDPTGPLEAHRRVDASLLSHEAVQRAMRPGYDQYGDYIPYADPLGDEDTLEGHPSARGCVQCRKIGLSCSLLTNRFDWPCEACLNDHESCQLIAPPRRKASCEGCKQGKLKCSFRDQMIQPAKCNECASKPGFECIAGPAPGYDPASTRYDEGALERRVRAFAACTSCREQKNRCTLKKTDAPPCKSCEENQIPCIFEAVFKLGDKGKARATARQDSAEVERQDLPDVEMQDTDYDSEVLDFLDPRPMPSATCGDATSLPKAPCFDADLNRDLPTFYIDTALCHPITFNCDIADAQFSDPFQSCSFCRDPTFAVFGHEEFVHVKVQEAHGGFCYEEKSRHGHYARNKQPTRICAQHTMEMHHMIQCAHSSIEAIDEQAALRINEGMLGLEATMSVEWLCSLCSSEMAYRCTAPCATDCFGEELDPPAMGCGLQLCFFCHQQLLEDFGGDVQALVQDMHLNSACHGQGRRADLELLRLDGLLTKNVEAFCET